MAKKPAKKKTAKPTSEIPRLQRKAKEPERIECPRCGCGHFALLGQRTLLSGEIRQRKECRHCGRVVNWTLQRN